MLLTKNSPTKTHLFLTQLLLQKLQQSSRAVNTRFSMEGSVQHTELTGTAAAHVPHETTGWTDGSVSQVGGASDTFSTLNMHSKPPKVSQLYAHKAVNKNLLLYFLFCYKIPYLGLYCRAVTSFSA